MSYITNINQKHHILLYKAFAGISTLAMLLRFGHTMKTGKYVSKSDIFFPTRIPLIDQNMMTIPFVVILISLTIIFFNLKYAISSKNQKVSSQRKTLIKQKTELESPDSSQFDFSSQLKILLPKWILSYFLFMIVYKGDNYLLQKTYGYDPSGHLLCSIVSYSNWINIMIHLPKDMQIFTIFRYIGLTLIFYQLFCTFFTVLIFHHYSETIFGIFNGLAISLIVFNTDGLFSDALFDIPKNVYFCFFKK